MFVPWLACKKISWLACKKISWVACKKIKITRTRCRCRYKRTPRWLPVKKSHDPSGVSRCRYKSTPRYFLCPCCCQVFLPKIYPTPITWVKGLRVRVFGWWALPTPDFWLLIVKWSIPDTRPLRHHYVPNMRYPSTYPSTDKASAPYPGTYPMSQINRG